MYNGTREAYVATMPRSNRPKRIIARRILSSGNIMDETLRPAHSNGWQGRRGHVPFVSVYGVGGSRSLSSRAIRS